jgi:hypothetical protein
MKCGETGTTPEKRVPVDKITKPPYMRKYDDYMLLRRPSKLGGSFSVHGFSANESHVNNP